jgi:hypothetical protein
MGFDAWAWGTNTTSGQQNKQNPRSKDPSFITPQSKKRIDKNRKRNFENIVKQLKESFKVN